MERTKDEITEMNRFMDFCMMNHKGPREVKAIKDIMHAIDEVYCIEGEEDMYWLNKCQELQAQNEMLRDDLKELRKDFFEKLGEKNIIEIL